MIKKKEFSDNLLVLVIPAAIGIEGNQYQSGVPHSPWDRTQKRKRSLESSDLLGSIGEPNFNLTQLKCPTAPDWHRRMVPIAKPIPPNPHNTNQLGSGTLPFPTVSLGSVMPAVPTSLQSNNSFALFSPAKSNPPLLRRGPVSERVRVRFSSESS